ncbi:MAG: hypothetical protein K6E22_02915, partial [Treponema sp.]|nr:hypothetical protein [Treponema sp.]
SCSGLVSPSVPDSPADSDSQRYTLSGSFSMPNASAAPAELSTFNSNSRNAIPDTSSLIYTVEAKRNSDGHTETTNSPDGSTYTFTNLTAGTWQITAYASTTGGTRVMQSETKSVTLSNANPVANTSLTMAPASGSGNIILTISWATGSGIGYCEWSSSDYSALAGSPTSPDSSVTINLNGLSSGTYSLTLSFYTSQASAIAGLPPVYECTEYVSVYPGLTTDSWAASTAPHIGSDGNFSVTKSCVETFVYRKIYVKQGASDSDATGTSERPFGTIEKAMARLSEAASKGIRSGQISATTPWELHVSGTFTATEITGEAFITVTAPITHLALIGEGSGATIDANALGTVVHVGGDASVSMQNLTLQNGNTTSGGGVYIDAGTFTMESGSITSNSASEYGGGVYVAEGGEFVMNNGTISGNDAVFDGGGVYNNDKFTMNNGTISGNSATGSSSAGGGVYSNGTFTMTNGTISGNTVPDTGNGLGGGVYTIGSGHKFDMQGGTITGNSAGKKGSGVYVDNSSTFKMSGGAKVDQSNDVYLISGLKITIDAPPTAEAPVATITPQSYATTTTVLGGSKLTDYYHVFAVTPKPMGGGTSEAWFTAKDGIIYNLYPITSLKDENYEAITKIGISDADGMDKLSQLTAEGKDFSGKTIELQANITLNGTYTQATTFKGTFDGKNYTIGGLNEQPALFGSLENGTIKALTVEGNTTRAGIVTKLETGGLIEGCTNKASVNGTETYVGGIAGIMQGDNPIIKNCINQGNITSSNGYLGGIAGRENASSGIIDSCVNKGTVTYTGSNYFFVGGIVGSAFGVVRNCINTGIITGGTATRVGGITGNTDTSGSSGVINCANTASVIGRSRVGGIAGSCDISDGENAVVKNCFNAGQVSASSGTSGGIVGEILTGGSGTCTFTSNHYKLGTASSGVSGKLDNNSNSTCDTPDPDQMNAWVNANNSGNLYKTWTTEGGNSVPNLGFTW